MKTKKQARLRSPVATYGRARESKVPTPKEIFGYIAGILAISAFIPYIIKTLNGRARPSRTTWVIWAIQDILTLVSYRYSGAQETIWVPLGFAIGASSIAILSLKYGEKTWEPLDVACMIGAVISIMIWPLMHSALIVMSINLFMGGVGAIPTLQKAWRDPASEDKLTWFLFIASCPFNLLAVKEWTFAIAIYPIAITLIDSSVAAVVFWPRKKGGPACPKSDASISTPNGAAGNGTDLKSNGASTNN